jgi:hypothetical protein
MVEPSTFEYWMSLLQEKHGRSLSEAYMQQMFSGLSARMSTEQFAAAAETIWAEDEFFPKLERFFQLSPQASQPAYQAFALPPGMPPAYFELSPEAQRRWEAERDAAKEMIAKAMKTAPRSRVMSSVGGSIVREGLGGPEGDLGAEIRRMNSWLSDPVLRGEAIAWAADHPDVEFDGASIREIDF